MKFAFINYEGMTLLDLLGVYDPISRLRTMGILPELSWDFCSFKAIGDETGNLILPEKRAINVTDDFSGLTISPNMVNPSLADYDYVVFPGGPASQSINQDPLFLDWVRTAKDSPNLISIGSGTLLLAASGLIDGKYTATQADVADMLDKMGIKVLKTRLVEDGNYLSSAGETAGLDLGLYLCQKLAGYEAADKIKRQIEYPMPLMLPFHPFSNQEHNSRCSRVFRRTGETEVDISVNLDGTGQNQIETGLPFLDHMLAQVAVHGLFDISIKAQGDLQVDPHHILEDTGLALGQAIKLALGDRAGIVRMASADCPMDESLAKVIVDLSGRPYTVLKGEWHQPVIGGLPTSLVVHFFESFSTQALCNLHAEIIYGRDGHHQAEALFKAFGRAILSATRLEPRRSGTIPSTKGSIG
jgi:imidazoleglycerol-phosphate dehydratase